MKPTKDIETREDIELLVTQFYKEIVSDDLIGFFFSDVVLIDLKTHLPIISDFWETLLFDKKKYRENAMLKHIQLSRKSKMDAKHFERWLTVWIKTIDSNFKGKIADKTKSRAQQIAALMKVKIAQDSDQNID